MAAPVTPPAVQDYLDAVEGDRGDSLHTVFETVLRAMKLDMGKSCPRFKRLEDVDLGIIASTVAATSVDDRIAAYQRVRG